MNNDKGIEVEREAARKGLETRALEALAAVRNMVVKRACDIEPEPLRWLWPGRIPLGQLTLLAGESGSGKSLVALDLAARVSRGAAWPDAPGDPRPAANVLVVTAHDDPAAMGRPRLERAGADLARVFFATGVHRPEKCVQARKRQLSLPDDLMSLAKAVFERRPMPLVVLDPAWAFCNRGRGRSRLAGPAQLAELAELAANLRVAIVCVTELRRETRGQTGFRAAGNQALLAAATTAWGLVRQPGQPEQRLMLPVKTKLGRDKAALAFDIVDDRVVWAPQPVEATGATVLAAEKAGSDLASAVQWLSEVLADGPQPASQINRQARECGYSTWTLRIARLQLGVYVHKQGFQGDARWVWSLNVAVESGARTNSRIFDEGAAPSADSRGIYEDEALAGAASSNDVSAHLR